MGPMMSGSSLRNHLDDTYVYFASMSIIFRVLDYADISLESFIGRLIVLIPAIMLLTSAVPQVHQICGSTFLLII